MKTETRDWLTRWPWWLWLIVRELPESGDSYLQEMFVPCILGPMSFAIPGLALVVFPEVRGVWYLFIFGGMLAYLLVGILTYFLLQQRSHGPWQFRGAW